MGWRRRNTYRHARLLEAAGLVERCQTTRGDGALLYATRRGVRFVRVPVVPASRPAPTWWAHHHACCWVAAWLTARGRVMQGGREVYADPAWAGRVRWRDQRGRHEVGHRPDLAWLADGHRIAIEVELAWKTAPRLDARLALHAAWRAAGRTRGVIYVCEDAAGCERLATLGAKHGLVAGSGGGLRVLELAEVRRQAEDARRGNQSSSGNTISTGAIG